MKTRIALLAGMALGSALLGGCAAGTPAPVGLKPAASQGPASRPDPDQGSATPAAAVAAGTPPGAAAMVCSTEARSNVTKILGLAAVPRTTDTWDGGRYTCSYALPEGKFAMTVQVFPSAPAAAAGAKALAGPLDAAPIKGLSNLGLPGYQSAAGTVVFAKDNFTLDVDATKLTATVGANQVTRAGFAYQMATTILACWSEH
ncbi:hypothetical protein [Arthrobacter sp. SDTb3-6]|uniref:hypothetical protein n=1 Tax=Arthrobacter sp. SDTb3-6 TaxID=2713571 RepID=UPI00159D941E|nr:hypothetical protein [Arthrobacter sp. SDTb3-6]NVM99581.1 hypothetical protein [Arthrobacter sp. SDTb3-6]